MKVLKTGSSLVCVLAMLASSLGYIPEGQAVERPPQYIAISFDGSYTNRVWDKLLDFSEEVKDTSPVKFTFFISGVYFLRRMPSPRANFPRVDRDFNKDNNTRWWNTNNYYVVPKRKRGSTFYEYNSDLSADENGINDDRNRGYSAIGFGDYNEDIVVRMSKLNRAHRQGHEIGSHANAHVGASEFRWSKENWDFEFKQFEDIIFNNVEINDIRPETLAPHLDATEKAWYVRLFENNREPIFARNTIRGFRAPQLGVGPNVSGVVMDDSMNSYTNVPSVLPALDESTFKYDASMIRSWDFWPKKEFDGIDINIMPLVSLNIVKRNARGEKYVSNQRTLSMDYNFYVAQTSGQSISDQTRLRRYKREMIDTYQRYFDHNYYGNRAPIHIGHHFSGWNKGIYWDALATFIKTNCGRPEVKCVTYNELNNFIEEKGSDIVHQYEMGDFEPMPKSGNLIQEASLELASMETDKGVAIAVADSSLEVDEVVTEYFSNDGEVDSPQNSEGAVLAVTNLVKDGEVVDQTLNAIIKVAGVFNPSTLTFTNFAVKAIDIADLGDLPCAHPPKEDISRGCSKDTLFSQIVSRVQSLISKE